MILSIGKKIAIGYSLALIITLIIAYIGIRNTNLLIDEVDWVNHTNEAINISDNVLRHLLDAEVGQRGFLLTGLDRYLEPFDSGVKLIDMEVDKLIIHTEDNPSQTEKIVNLRLLIIDKINELERTIILRRNSIDGFNEALQVVVSDEGKDIMDNIRLSISEIISEEDSLLIERESMYNSVASSSTRNILLTLLLSTSILLSSGIYFINNIKKSINEHLVTLDKVMNGDFSAKVSNITNDELGFVGKSINKMTDKLSELQEDNEKSMQLINDSQDNLENILSSLPVGVLIYDNSTGIITSANIKALILLGETSEGLINKEYTDFIFMDGDETYLDNKLDELKIPVYTTKSSIFIGGKNYVLLSIIDITARIEVEEERLVNEKLQGVLEMAGTTCHELNQPLQIVSGYTQLILAGLKENNSIKSKMTTIYREVERMGNITLRIQNISKYKTVDYLDGKIIDINEEAKT